MASVVIGVMVTRSPIGAIALLVICTVIVIALTRPALLFAAGIILLAVEPGRIFGTHSTAGRPETDKLILYACTLPFLFSRGIDRRKCAPFVAYVIVTMLTEYLATPLPGLTTTQTADSLATLSLGWLVFAINWDWRRDHPLLKVLTWMPSVSVLIGLALYTDGILEPFRGTPPRLQGATIAAWLGTFSLCAVIACLVLYRRKQWKWAGWLGLINVVILGATLTRGAVLALLIATIPLLVRFCRRQLSVRNTAGVIRVGTAIAVIIVGAAVLIPGLISRDETAADYVAGRDVATHEIASGRLEAWSIALKQAEVNLVFGRGIGAGPLVGKAPGTPEGFTAQHNEYVGMLVEGGIVGTVILLTAIVTTMVSVIRRAPLRVRADLAAAGVAFAIYAFTENILSATPLAVAFLLVFGIASSCEGASASLSKV